MQTDFVSWYDGHPDYPRTWPLEAEQVAVLGNGNVALDVSRILSKHADDLLVTEIPDNVYEGLKASPTTATSSGRRGPAQMKFTRSACRELAHSRDVDIVLYEEDFQFDEASEEAMERTRRPKVMMKTLRGWLEDQKNNEADRIRRLHLHFLHSRTRFSAKTARSWVCAWSATNWTARAASSAPASTWITRAGRLPRHRLLWFRAT